MKAIIQKLEKQNIIMDKILVRLVRLINKSEELLKQLRDKTLDTRK